MTPPTVISRRMAYESLGNVYDLSPDTFENKVSHGNHLVLQALSAKYPFREIHPEEIWCEVTLCEKGPVSHALFQDEGVDLPTNIEAHRFFYKYRGECIEVHSLIHPKISWMTIATEEYRRFISIPSLALKAICKVIQDQLKLSEEQLLELSIDSNSEGEERIANKQMNKLPSVVPVYVVELTHLGRKIVVKTDTDLKWIKLIEYSDDAILNVKAKYLRELPICPPEIVRGALDYFHKELQKIYPSPFQNIVIQDILGDSFENCASIVNDLYENSVPPQMQKTTPGYKLYFSYQKVTYCVLSDLEGTKFSCPMIHVERIPQPILDKLIEDGHRQIQIISCANKIPLDDDIVFEFPIIESVTTDEELSGYEVVFKNLQSNVLYTLNADAAYNKIEYRKQISGEDTLENLTS